MKVHFSGICTKTELTWTQTSCGTKLRNINSLFTNFIYSILYLNHVLNDMALKLCASALIL